MGSQKVLPGQIEVKFANKLLSCEFEQKVVREALAIKAYLLVEPPRHDSMEHGQLDTRLVLRLAGMASVTLARSLRAIFV